MDKSSRRVVVTGLGLISPAGNSVSAAWEVVNSGISSLSHVDPSFTGSTLVRATGSVSLLEGLLEKSTLTAKDRRRLSLCSQYALLASNQAIDDSGLTITDSNRHRVGVIIGSGMGGQHIIQKNATDFVLRGPKKVSPFFIPAGIVNMPSGFVAQKIDCLGPCFAAVSACASASHSIGTAARLISHGDADVMITGGTEACINLLTIAGFENMKALSLSQDPGSASRPWDQDRDGFVISEGAGTLVLEELEYARSRGATIYAELVGFGASADAYHFTQPEPSGRGMEMAMRNALSDAGLAPADIDYVNAHATSTPAGDMIEHDSIARLMHSTNPGVLVSSTKSVTGHMLGAAGAAEAIFSIMAMREGLAPPTINLDKPQAGVSLDLVPHQSKEKDIRTVLSNSFGFGGTNSCLIFSSL